MSGSLSICLLEGSHLKAMDFMTQSSDPYVKVIIDQHEQKTPYRLTTTNPIWVKELLFENVERGKDIEFQVWDRDDVSKDDLVCDDYEK